VKEIDFIQQEGILIVKFQIRKPTSSCDLDLVNCARSVTAMNKILLIWYCSLILKFLFCIIGLTVYLQWVQGILNHWSTSTVSYWNQSKHTSR